MGSTEEAEAIFTEMSTTFELHIPLFLPLIPHLALMENDL